MLNKAEDFFINLHEIEPSITQVEKNTLYSLKGVDNYPPTQTLVFKSAMSTFRPAGPIQAKNTR